MEDQIFPIEALPAAKRRKLWAQAHAQIELPMPSPLSGSGALVVQVAHNQFLKIAEEGKTKVIETSLENTRQSREDHQRESKLLHERRHRRSAELKSLSNRKIDKI